MRYILGIPDHFNVKFGERHTVCVYSTLVLQLHTLHTCFPTHWHVIVKSACTGSFLPKCLLSESQDLLCTGKSVRSRGCSDLGGLD